MVSKPYPSDVTDEEWDFVASFLTLMTEDAPQREHNLREVFNAIPRHSFRIRSPPVMAASVRRIASPIVLPLDISHYCAPAMAADDSTRTIMKLYADTLYDRGPDAFIVSLVDRARRHVWPSPSTAIHQGAICTACDQRRRHVALLFNEGVARK